MRNRNEWQNSGEFWRKATLAGFADIYGDPERPDTPAQARLRAEAEGLPAPRARPVQREAAEARVLAVEAYRRWWWPGFRRIEHRTPYAREADQRSEEGVRAGCPDVELWIPPGWGDTYRGRAAVVCALELKAPPGPRREVAHEWWLEPCDGKTHYGLRPDQRHWLRTMAGCGARTLVAFSGRDAVAWLDEQAGPRPEVMPW